MKLSYMICSAFVLNFGSYDSKVEVDGFIFA